ncbi:MAG: 2-hydroxychromene-2-carboxylate isomerase [Burkholderiaceae bacterium]|nr:2-hydroxychromene-2-carboxylate isomerase [Burkholderiaceae bacterium]MDZ4145546.1 2-hydroxychromene-2-carboxylate isomerase [Burkholderiales bacterium]
MKHIDFYLDFISPYAYLAFEKLPEALLGLSYSVTYKPVLFAAILKHHGQLGPAEISGKREWTYRQVLWLARQQGVALDLPLKHPFNPLPLLRLAVACNARGNPNRYVCETLFRHVWHGGADAADPQRQHALEQALAPQRRLDADDARAALQANTSEAIAAGVFGVPTFGVDGHVFWGLDALPLLRAHLEGDDWIGGAAWRAAAAVTTGIVRKP